MYQFVYRFQRNQYRSTYILSSQEQRRKMKLQCAVYLRNYCHVVSSFCFHFVEVRVNERSEICIREKPIYMDMHCNAYTSIRAHHAHIWTAWKKCVWTFDGQIDYLFKVHSIRMHLIIIQSKSRMQHQTIQGDSVLVNNCLAFSFTCGFDSFPHIHVSKQASTHYTCTPYNLIEYTSTPLCIAFSI